MVDARETVDATAVFGGLAEIAEQLATGAGGLPALQRTVDVTVTATGAAGASFIEYGHDSGRVVAAAGLSSITTIEQMSLFGVDPLPDVTDERDRSVLTAFAERALPPPRLYLACGRDDLLIEHNRDLHRALADRGVAHEWIEDDGRHEWA